MTCTENPDTLGLKFVRLDFVWHRVRKTLEMKGDL